MTIKWSIAENNELIFRNLIFIQIKILNNFACNLNWIELDLDWIELSFLN
jgi:hypothetical protein